MPNNLVAGSRSIQHILRTGTCVPGSVFLVEGVECVDVRLEDGDDDGDDDDDDDEQPAAAVRTINNVGRRMKMPKVRSRRRMGRIVRVLLGDGELCIQALLGRGIHGAVGQVSEGWYVRVDEFELCWVDGEDGRTCYLLVRDMVPVGWNGVLKGEAESKSDVVSKGTTKDSVKVGDSTTKTGTVTRQFEEMAIPARVVERAAAAVEPPRKTMKTAPPEAKRPFVDVDYLSDSDDEAFEKLDIETDRAAERRLGTGNSAPLQQLGAAVLERHQKGSGGAHAWLISDFSNPVKLTHLRSIPNLPYKQNWKVNVLAVVVSLSDVEPAHLPPYSQRTARLADPSTSKRVLLTVFLDPEGFTPAVGSVVLLAGVKNHRFDGGCLKKYASDKPEDGMKSWWLENPVGLEWCEEEVQRLRSWWVGQQQLSS